MFYEKVFRALNKARVKYAVAGGIAVNLYGVPRMTQDLDLLVELSAINIKKLTMVLKSLGYHSRLPVNPELIADPIIRKQWITKKNMKVFSFYHHRIPIQEIDLLVTAPLKINETLKRKVIKRAGNLLIPLVPILDLIKMKEKAGRAVDLSDIQMLKTVIKKR
ncbi:MAG: hypothetical protein AAB019_10575 [Planctomycetota bacterium]